MSVEVTTPVHTEEITHRKSKRSSIVQLDENTFGVTTEVSMEALFDKYASKKSNAHNLFNISLMLTIITSMVFRPKLDATMNAVFLLVGTASLVVQFVVGVILVVLSSANENKIGCTDCVTLNNLVVVFSALTPVLSGTLLIIEGTGMAVAATNSTM